MAGDNAGFKRKLDEAVKKEDPRYMTPKKPRRAQEGSPDYSPAVEVEMPSTAEARRIAAQTTKEEEDRSKAAKGIRGGKQRKGRTMRRKSRKHRRTHKKRSF